LPIAGCCLDTGNGPGLRLAHLGTASLAGGWTPSPPSEGGEGWGEEGRPSHESPLSPALSPLVPRGAREKTAAVSRCARLFGGIHTGPAALISALAPAS
jgi:hypothetical protein